MPVGTGAAAPWEPAAAAAEVVAVEVAPAVPTAGVGWGLPERLAPVARAAAAEATVGLALLEPIPERAGHPSPARG
ncbi:hypothetical protein [Mesorhizobium sp.]|uniref:hypothetical protein n=1 Tax=Mesorhizobium sp. TaxID=1871066 RepID=UPI0025EA64A3|nr:hypothetical protein [Mesorhizobium sp.]